MPKLRSNVIDLNLEKQDEAIIRDFMKKMSSKRYDMEVTYVKNKKNDDYHRQRIYNNKKKRRNNTEEFYEVCELAGKINAFRDGGFVINNFININNNFKGMFSDAILKGMLRENDYGQDLFKEFLRFLKDSYRKTPESIQNNKDLYYKYISVFKEYLFMTDSDVEWLSERKNQITMYNLLKYGGEYFRKGNSVSCFLSLFFKQSSITEEEYDDFTENYYYKYTYKPIDISDNFIMGLIKSGYLNKFHLTTTLKTLKQRDYYISKKKRKKRTYTEDRSYYYLDLRKLRISDEFVTKVTYNKEVPKLHIDKSERRKTYRPTLKIDMKTVYFKNELKCLNFLWFCTDLILKLDKEK